MLSAIQAIQTHLWVLTALLALIFLAAGYCNYSRIKERNRSSIDPYQRMKELWDKGDFTQLRSCASAHLRDWPNSEDALMYQAKALLQLDSLDEARAIAEHLAATSPLRRFEAKEMLEMIDERAGS